MFSASERIAENTDVVRKAQDSMAFSLRVCIPGIVESFDREKQTAVVNVALRENIVDLMTGDKSWVEIPPLLDVPIVFPRAGGYGVYAAVNKGDECLVMFADMCIDSWWQSGGIQNQIEKRRHDLSDAFAVMGCWSQPRVIPNYPSSGIQVRNDEGTAKIEIVGNVINIIAEGDINIHGAHIKMNE